MSILDIRSDARRAESKDMLQYVTLTEENFFIAKGRFSRNYSAAWDWNIPIRTMVYNNYLRGGDMDFKPEQSTIDMSLAAARDKANDRLQDENARALTLEVEHLKEKRRLEEVEKSHNREVYLSGDWDENTKLYFKNEWLKKYKHLSRQDIFTRLQSDTIEPWIHIGNCLNGRFVSPTDSNTYDVDMFYNYTIPVCGVYWDVYNDPEADISISRKIELASMFSGLSKASRQVTQKASDTVGDALDSLGGRAKKVKEELEAPYYVGMAVAGIAALAVISTKVSK